jgi:hypothetical protein
VAIYRCEFKIISRSAGHKACAAAAYRAAEKIVDRTYGLTHDFTRKSNVTTSFILAPDNAPAWMQDRAQLWNAVEAVERRKDAQLSREVLLSLPHELTDDQREALVRQFVSERFVSRGMIADVAIHGHSPSGDERNDHAHILLTTRTLTEGTLGGFGSKERSWNSKEFLHETRVAWAESQNRLFERLGLPMRVDHRSLADQGQDREPEPKLGSAATQALRNGEPEKAEGVVGEYLAVKDRNADRERLKEQLDVIDLASARLDKAQGDHAAEAVAALALRHASDFEALQDAQRAAQMDMRRAAMDDLRQAVTQARAEHDAYRRELKPGFFRRLGEIVTLKGRAAKAERDAKLAAFKEGQDAKLNALRARLRADGRALIGAQADERDALREVQARERAALDRQLEQDQARQLDAMIERMKARHAQADGRSGTASPSPALPAATPAPAPVPIEEPAPMLDSLAGIPGYDADRLKAMSDEVDRIVAKIIEDLQTAARQKERDESGAVGSASGGLPPAGPTGALVNRDPDKPVQYRRGTPEPKAQDEPSALPADLAAAGYDAARLKAIDAATDKVIDELRREAERSRAAASTRDDDKGRDAGAKGDPARAAAPAAPASKDVKRKPQAAEDVERALGFERTREPPVLDEPAWMKAPEDRKPLSKEEMEQLAKREKAIRMRKARDARAAKARERDRGRDDGYDR